MAVRERSDLGAGSGEPTTRSGPTAPDDVLRSARNLDPEFVVARYPSRALGNPIERYSADGAADRLSESRRVLAWVRTRLGGA